MLATMRPKLPNVADISPDQAATPESPRAEYEGGPVGYVPSVPTLSQATNFEAGLPTSRRCKDRSPTPFRKSDVAASCLGLGKR